MSVCSSTRGTYAGSFSSCVCARLVGVYVTHTHATCIFIEKMACGWLSYDLRHTHEHTILRSIVIYSFGGNGNATNSVLAAVFTSLYLHLQDIITSDRLWMIIKFKDYVSFVFSFSFAEGIACEPP